MTNRDISVIICAYTEARWDDLLSAVASVQEQTCPPREIIVVIDHNPALVGRVREHIRQIVVIENAETQGLSGARNSGIAVAQGELATFLDDDAVAAPDWLAKLSEHLKSPEVLGVGGLTEPLWLGAHPNWFPEEFYWVIGCSYRGLPDTAAPVRNPFGGNMCVRRALFDLVGGFKTGIGRDRSMLRGCEETEFCIRAREHLPQGVFIYEPQARIFHRVPVQRTQWSYFSNRCYAEGVSKAIVTRWHGAKTGLAAERSYTFQVLPRAIARDLIRTIVDRDVAGVLKAGVTVAGLCLTIAGFTVGTCSRSGILRADLNQVAQSVKPAAPSHTPDGTAGEVLIGMPD